MRNLDTCYSLTVRSDTVAATLTWIAYELCVNRGVQDELWKHLDALGGETAHLTADELQRCEYLDGVIKEGLRLHPAVRRALVPPVTSQADD
jgi:cytochrome P450